MNNIVSRSNALTLYYSLFYPHMDYGLLLWGAAAKTTLKPIFILQKKAIRLIGKTTYNAHTTPLFANFKVIKFEDVCELQLAKFIYGLYNNLSPLPLKSFFSTNKEKHTYETRNRDNPMIRRHRTQVAARSVYTRAYKIWYNMEPVLKQSLTLKKFSSAVKANILEQYANP